MAEQKWQKTNEFGDIAIETTQNETEREKSSRKQNQKSISELQENFMFVLKDMKLEPLKEKRKRGDNMFKEKQRKNSNVMKITNPYIRGTQ